MKYELFTEEGEDILTLEIDYKINPFTPGKMNLSNGDPGYPDEGGDIEEISAKWRGIDITSTLTEYEMKQLKRAIYRDAEDERM